MQAKFLSLFTALIRADEKVVIILLEIPQNHGNDLDSLVLRTLHTITIENPRHDDVPDSNMGSVVVDLSEGHIDICNPLSLVLQNWCVHDTQPMYHP